MMAEFLGVDVPFVQSLWGENTYQVELKQALVDEIEQIMQWALGTGSAPPGAKPFQPRHAVFDGLLQQVAPAKVSVK
jgi:hypothetical protein